MGLVLTLSCLAPLAVKGQGAGPARSATDAAVNEAACAAFKTEVTKTYNFKPSKLNKKQQTAKSEAMDRFWTMVKEDPEHLLPCLRAALNDAKADQWFRFDASSLLVELDPTQASKELQVRCFTGVDLADADLQTWVQTLAARGVEGIDTSAAAARWLAYPSVKAKYWLPQHGAHEVNQIEGALFLFGSMDEAQATPALVKIVSDQKHPGRETALMLLTMQATEESLRALRALDTSSFSKEAQKRVATLITKPELLKPRAEPKTKREEFVTAFTELLEGNGEKFQALVAAVPDGEHDAVAVLKPEDLPLLRKVRRKMISIGNQHMIEYYTNFTEILMARVWK